MSALLEQAIVDASALKQAAIKNAEAAIVEKYSTDIKKAVESLLEQDDLGFEEEAFGAEEEDSPESAVVDKLPLGAADADENEEWVVSFQELKDMADRLAGDQPGETDMTGEPLPHQAAADTVLPLDGGQEASISMPLALEEDQELDMDDLDDLLEELIVDFEPQKGGWSAMTPDDIMDFKAQLKLANMASNKVETKNKELKQAAERLAEEKRTLVGKNKKLMRAFQSLKEKFEQVNLSNARLIYTNRILTNNSLNERQKSKIVESLSSADSIEEAKVIFETLQSAVGSVHQRKQPKSLREVIQRTSGTSLRRESREAEGPEVSRMQILAGIKNK